LSMTTGVTPFESPWSWCTWVVAVPQHADSVCEQDTFN
jgi:hypothetical protein